MKASPIIHRTETRVRYQETDQMGIAHHSVYITWFELGRTDMMRRYGLSYADMERSGTLLAVAEVALKYHKPARFDELLAVDTRLTEIGHVRLRFDYEVRRLEPRNERQEDLLCTGHTVLAAVDRNFSLQRIPQKDRELLERLLAGKE